MSTSIRNASAKSRLNLERLETREVLSASFIDRTGGLVVQGTNANDTIRVSDHNANGTKWLKVEVNGAVEWHNLQKVTSRVVTLNGYLGNDSLINNSGQVKTLAYGGAGNDFLSGSNLADRLVGGAGNDLIRGWGGNDVLVGEGGNDRIFGGAGSDSIYGGAGDDFLDGQQNGAFLHGGAGFDVDANSPSINGCSQNDVLQQGSTACWFLSSLGEVSAFKNIAHDLIRYDGDGKYTVFFYNANLSRWEGQSVVFDGSTNGGDAAVTSTANTSADAAGCDAEFWVMLMQRGLNARYGVNYLDANAVRWADYGFGAGRGGVASTAMSLLGVGYQQLFVNDFAGMRSALASGKALVAGFKPWNEQTTTKLVSEAHAYQIVALDDVGNVTLRNPWGRDGCRDGTVQGADDGYIVLTWSEFTGNATSVTRSA